MLLPCLVLSDDVLVAEKADEGKEEFTLTLVKEKFADGEGRQ